MQAIWRGDKVKSMNRGIRDSGAASVKTYQAVPLDDYPGERDGRDGIYIEENQVEPVGDRQAIPVQYRRLVEKKYQSVHVNTYQPLPVNEYKSPPVHECQSSSVDEYQTQEINEHCPLDENGKPQPENECKPPQVKDYESVSTRYQSVPLNDYRSISLVPSLSWSSDDEDSDDDIILRNFTKSESECPLLYRESGE